MVGRATIRRSGDPATRLAVDLVEHRYLDQRACSARAGRPGCRYELDELRASGYSVLDADVAPVAVDAPPRQLPRPRLLLRPADLSAGGGFAFAEGRVTGPFAVLSPAVAEPADTTAPTMLVRENDMFPAKSPGAGPGDRGRPAVELRSRSSHRDLAATTRSATLRSPGAGLAGLVEQRWHHASPATCSRHVATVQSFAHYCARTRSLEIGGDIEWR